MKFTRQLELAEIKAGAEELHDLGVKVIFRWVPGHAQIPGNERADVICNEASKPKYRNTRDFKYILPLEWLPRAYTRGSKIRRKTVLQTTRHARIEKIATSRSRPLKRYYASHIEQAIYDIEAGIRGSFLDMLDDDIDGEIAKNQEDSFLGSQA